MDIDLVHKKDEYKNILKYLKVCSRYFIKGFDLLGFHCLPVDTQ